MTAPVYHQARRDRARALQAAKERAARAARFMDVQTELTHVKAENKRLLQVLADGIKGIVKAFNATKKLLCEANIRNATLKKNANYDELTGLFSRHYIMNKLNGWIGNGRPEARLPDDQVLCVLVVDFDNFKPKNDTFGHKIGDYCLQFISQRIKSVLRTDDLLVRQGGDEFMIVFPIKRDGEHDIVHPVNGSEIMVRDPIVVAAIVAEKVRLAVAEKPFVVRTGIHKGTEIDFTVSIGCAVYDPKENLTAHEIMNKPDEALYYAKEKGHVLDVPRNRVSIQFDGLDKPVHFTNDISRLMDTAKQASAASSATRSGVAPVGLVKMENTPL